MSIRLRRFGAALLILSLAAATACSTGYENQIQRAGNSAAKPQASSAPGEAANLGADDAVIPLLSINDKKYVPISDLVKTLQLNTAWNSTAGTLRMGDNDLPLAFTIDSTKAEKDGDPITLPDAPKQQGDSSYLPVSAVADLLRAEMSAYEIQGDRMILHPSNIAVVDRNQAEAAGQNEAQLDFADDPNDPFKGPPSNPTTGAVTPVSMLQQEGDLPAVARVSDHMAAAAAAKSIDIDGLIQRGKTYLGVKYMFGAAPYPVSGRFDCSSFTQYLFGKYGISLPRLARQQSTRGTLVSRKSLRKGDLLFFYVPGRFKSNSTVGHVGIYIGNGQMLNANSAPLNGVQITNINKPYWQRVFLFAKRIV
jgi:cell wall-associated NlpC family hydrolase